MSYYGVHCSYCGQRGHNRLSCPERKKRAAEDPESYEAKSLAREAATRAEAVKSRTCSYCGNPGHNRRSCKALREDKLALESLQQRYVDSFVSSCSRKGLGLGALIRVRGKDYDHDGNLNLVTLLVTDIISSGLDFLHRVSPNPTWNIHRRGVIQGRVLKAEYFESGYHIPKQDSLFCITANRLGDLLPDFITPSDTSEHESALSHPKIQILAPSFIPLPLSGAPKAAKHGLLTQEINKSYNLGLSGMEKPYAKYRLQSTSEMWSFVYPERWKAEMNTELDSESRTEGAPFWRPKDSRKERYERWKTLREQGFFSDFTQLEERLQS